jgi:hypothetical protein
MATDHRKGRKPLDMTEEQSVNNPLSTLIDRELSSIEFVLDYYQFRFRGPVLTVIVEPILTVNNHTYEYGAPEYYNLLLQCIGKTVITASVIEDEALDISFSNHYAIHISLRPEDHISPEAVIFDDIPSKRCWVW